MMNPFKARPQDENQKVEAVTTDAQPAKGYPAYEPPKAEVISFENEYVRAAMNDNDVFTVMTRGSAGQSDNKPTHGGGSGD